MSLDRLTEIRSVDGSTPGGDTLEVPSAWISFFGARIPPGDPSDEVLEDDKLSKDFRVLACRRSRELAELPKRMSVSHSYRNKVPGYNNEDARLCGFRSSTYTKGQLRLTLLK